MSLLRFDPHPMVDDEVSDTSLAELAPALEELRSELTSTGNPRQDSLAPLIGDDRSFFRLPEFQYVAYVEHREASDLGRIFQIANGLHDDIDSAIVLGESAIVLGAKSLMQACCDPYHNELSRALRGSKPRLYFQPNPHENDALSSLLLRLRQPDAETPAQKRWAIVVLDDVLTSRPNFAAQHLERELSEVLGQDADRDLQRYVIPIGSNPRSEGGCGFTLPAGVAGTRSVLSPASMLPAALLGLDCMKLLEGAVAINDHFEKTQGSENLVFRMAARHHGLVVRGRRNLSLCVWSQSLEMFAQWYAHLARQVLPKQIVTTVWTHPRDTDRFLERLHPDQGDATAQHFLVQKSRCDTLFESESQSMDQAMFARFHETVQASCLPSTRITLPRIDTFVMGQLFQLSMIVTWIQKRLADASSTQVG